MSRNKDRLGLGDSRPEAADPPPHALQQESSGFAFVVPTEFVELPSQGKYYPEGHPLHMQDSIEIKQMTAKEEDMLSSRTLLKKGIALERVIQSLILDSSINPESLLIGDRNAIIIATRVSGYGREYDTNITCPGCGTAQPYSFDLNDATVYNGDDLDQLDVQSNGNGTFNVTLPRTQAVVTFRLLTGYDEKASANALRKNSPTADKMVTTQIKNLVVAVNGDTSPEAIKYLVENIPSMDSRHLRLSYRLAAPNVDLTQHFVCGECEYDQDVEVPLSADFFWPDR